MKFLKLTIATVAALWTIGVIAGVVLDIGKHGGTRGVAQLAGGIGASALCLVITYWLFVWALKTPVPRAGLILPYSPRLALSFTQWQRHGIFELANARTRTRCC